MGKHLVFYDGSCGFCDHAVQFVLKHDQKEDFVFAPLQGTTAKSFLKEVPPEDSLVLIENYKSQTHSIYQLGKGAFRILWLLGGMWVLLGWIAFLPSFLYDWGYRLIARNRHRFFSKDVCPLPNPKQKDRFLP